MKKVFGCLMVVMLALSVLFGAAACVGSIGSADAATADETLYVYNWGDYIDLDVIDSFEAMYKTKYGKSINVVYSTYDTNEIMLTNVLNGDDSIDLVCPSEYAIEKLLKEGAAEKLDYSKIPNKTNVMAEIYEKVNEVFTGITDGNGAEIAMSDYFVPYMWGTLGILYNTDVVTEDDIASGYGILWNAAGNAKLNDKIMIKDSIRDTYVAGVLHLKETNSLPAGYEDKSVQELINTLDETILKAVEETLVKQKKALKDYEVDFGKQDMLAGRAYVDLAWSGDALWAMEDGDNLDYYVPEVGGNIWFDGWVMLKNAQNKPAAYEFINYMCDPEVAIANAMEIGYTSAMDKEVMKSSEAVRAVLTENEYDVEEYFADEIRYPVIKDSPLGVMKDFGDMNSAAVSMWERVKADSQMWILYVVLGVVAAAGIGVGLFFYFKNKKGSRRKKA